MTAAYQAGLRRDVLAHEVDGNEWARWLFLKDAPTEDAWSEKLVEVANGLRQAAEVWGRSSVRRTCLTFAQLALALTQRELLYADDLGTGEDIRGFTRPNTSPMETVDKGGDDCDEKARLFVALCLAAGIGARMVGWWSKAGTFDHVSAEILVPGEAGGTEWIHAETIIKRAMLGEMADAVPREADGRWLR